MTKVLYKKLLFVCTGNTCRSPMAEALFTQIAAKENLIIEVKSAGICTVNGLDMSKLAKTALKELEISHGHSSTVVDPELIEWADLVLTMTLAHKYRLWHDYAEHKNKIWTLKEYVTPTAPSRNLDIHDPYGGDIAVYQKCAQDLLKSLNIIIEKVKGDDTLFESNSRM